MYHPISLWKTWALVASLSALASVGIPAPVFAEDGASIETILRRFADDFGSDPTARMGKFGFDVDGERWHVVITARQGEAPDVQLLQGFPTDAIFYFQTDKDTLIRLDQGMTGETATARARAGDTYPLRTGVTDNFPRYLINEQFSRFTEQLRLHFFSRGQPEIFQLSVEHSRLSHDVQAIGLVFREGLRTVWGALLPSQHANKDPEDQTNPFDTLVVAMKGQCQAKIGGKNVDIVEGIAVSIPAGMLHEFWNAGNETCEVFIVMYGDGA